MTDSTWTEIARMIYDGSAFKPEQLPLFEELVNE